MNAWLKMTLAAAIAAAVVAMGCGGGGDSTAGSESAATSASPLSKVEFVKQANAACIDEREGAFERIDAYTKRHSSEGLPEAILAAKALRAGLLTTIAAETKALGELEPPRGDEKEIEAIMAGIQADFVKAKKVKAKASLHPEEIEDKFLDVDKLIRRYGLSSCVK